MEQDIDKIINDLEMALLTDLYGHITTLVKKEDLEHLIKAYEELEESNQEKAKMLTEQNRNLQISYDSLQELFELRKYKNSSIPVSLVEETIEELKQYKLSLLKENYVEKQKEFKSQNVLVCNAIRDIAVTGKIDILQELLEKRK